MRIYSLVIIKDLTNPVHRPMFNQSVIMFIDDVLDFSKTKDRPTLMYEPIILVIVDRLFGLSYIYIYICMRMST